MLGATFWLDYTTPVYTWVLKQLAASFYWCITMAEYDDLDDATLKQMLSDATSYEERAALRQAMRKKKKAKGESTTQAKARGNSVYNRFAGTSAPKSSTKTKGTGVVKPIDKPKQGAATLPTHRKDSPVQQSATSTRQPITSTPPLTPDPTQDPHDETDATPVHVEPAEDKQVDQDQQDIGALEEIPDETDQGLNEEVIPSTEVDSVEFKQDSIKLKPGVDSYADLHQYLVAYVNQALFLDPPLPLRGKALYDTCSDPTLLCKLINKSVPGTVDLRALSKISGSAAQCAEAMQDNMTLVIESARAIGCPINDSMPDKILHKEPETINQFLVDLIRARVVHMPGMEDEPASTFTDLHSLFQKLHVSVEEQGSKPVSWRDDPDKVRKALQANSPPTKGSWRDNPPDSTDLTYEQRAALRKAEREQRQREKEHGEKSVGLTYEERATRRKEEREQRRKEREALAK